MFVTMSGFFFVSGSAGENLTWVWVKRRTDGEPDMTRQPRNSFIIISISRT